MGFKVSGLGFRVGGGGGGGGGNYPKGPSAQTATLGTLNCGNYGIFLITGIMQDLYHQPNGVTESLEGQRGRLQFSHRLFFKGFAKSI